MTELYTMMRYLQWDTLKQKHLNHFDSWASTFGETTTAIELAPEGTGYRARTRFAKFFNLPEPMNIFKEVADIKTSDQLHLPVPEGSLPQCGRETYGDSEGDGAGAFRAGVEGSCRDGRSFG